MRTDVLTGPAPWAVNRFGDNTASQLWARIPTALAAAVTRGCARDGGRPIADHQFTDERWPVPYEELGAHLVGADGVALLRAPRGPQPVLAVRDQILLPWCYGPSGAVSMRDTWPGRSFGRLARELLRALPANRAPNDPTGLRDLARDGAFRQTPELRARADAAPRILIAGYACTARYGLLRVCLGQASVAEEGDVAWDHVTDLPLPPPSIPRPARQRFP